VSSNAFLAPGYLGSRYRYQWTVGRYLPGTVLVFGKFTVTFQKLTSFFLESPARSCSRILKEIESGKCKEVTTVSNIYCGSMDPDSDPWIKLVLWIFFSWPKKVGTAPVRYNLVERNQIIGRYLPTYGTLPFRDYVHLGTVSVPYFPWIRTYGTRVPYLIFNGSIFLHQPIQITEPELLFCVYSDGKELTRALEDLSRMSVDPTFALEFFTRKGEHSQLLVIRYRYGTVVLCLHRYIPVPMYGYHLWSCTVSFEK